METQFRVTSWATGRNAIDAFSPSMAGKTTTLVMDGVCVRPVGRVLCFPLDLSGARKSEKRLRSEGCSGNYKMVGEPSPKLSRREYGLERDVEIDYPLAPRMLCWVTNLPDTMSSILLGKLTAQTVASPNSSWVSLMVTPVRNAAAAR